MTFQPPSTPVFQLPSGRLPTLFQPASTHGSAHTPYTLCVGRAFGSAATLEMSGKGQPKKLVETGARTRPSGRADRARMAVGGAQ
jgi:hypothetical protein